METTTPEVPAVDLTNLVTRDDLTALESRMAATINVAPARTLSVREAFELQMLDAQANNGHLRALSDVVSSGNAGILPPQWSSMVRDAVDAQRYFIPRCGSIGFPASGYTLTIPKVTQHTTVAARGTEKTTIPSRALTTGSDVFTAAWYAGGVDVAMELVWQSDPSVMSLVVQSLFSQYAIATDQAATLAAETVAGPTGAALDFSTYGAFVAQVVAEAEAIRAATGAPGDVLSMTTASWMSLISLVDAGDRRLFSTQGSQNADGSASLLARSIDVGGIAAFHNPRAAEDLQFAAANYLIAEKPPVQVQSDNVSLMGRDLGILGAILQVPTYGASGLSVWSVTA